MTEKLKEILKQKEKEREKIKYKRMNGLERRNRDYILTIEINLLRNILEEE